MSKKRIKARCEYCSEAAVYAHPTSEKLTIRCHSCQRVIFRYYAEPTLRPPDPDSLHKAEADLLAEATLPARALYEGLRRLYRTNGYAPTIRELTVAMGWRSTNNTRHHLEALEQVGLIERDYGAARGIRLPYVA
jgi:hypothetical protein